jgi:membrane protein required for colicin V production
MSFLDLSLLFDFFLFIIVGYFIFRGAKSGAVSCLFSLLALCIAFPITCYFFPLLATLFPQKVTRRILGDSIAFATTLIGLYFLTLILIWAILKAFKRFREDISDQIAGGILGLLKGVVIIFIVILLMITLFPSKTPLVKDSFLSRATISIINAIAKPFPPSLKRKFNQKKKQLELYWRQTPRRK